MNIFVTDPSPITSALWLDDRRVVKMILETAQLMSTALIEVGVEGVDSLYRPTHAGHPCSVWARSTRSNFEWLGEHGLALARVYGEAYCRVHRSSEVVREALRFRGAVAAGPLAPFANATDFKDLPVHEAYAAHLTAKWRRSVLEDPRAHLHPTWRGREAPPFWTP